MRSSIRRTLSIPLLLVLFLVAATVVGRAEAQPSAVFDETVIDVGAVNKGERASYEFTLQNEGDQVLEITQVKPSCGCTVAEYDKTINPGDKLVWRVYDRRGKATADLLSLDDEDPHRMGRIYLHHPTEYTTYRTLGQDQVSEIEPLLVDVLRQGESVYDFPSIEEMRERRQKDVERLDSGVKRLINPHIYHVSLTEQLWNLKQGLIKSVRESS